MAVIRSLHETVAYHSQVFPGENDLAYTLSGGTGCEEELTVARAAKANVSEQMNNRL